MTITRTSCSHRPLHRPNLVIEPGFKYMIRDRTNAALLVLGSYFLLFLAPHLGAQVSFQYDLAGNLVTQSNTVPAAPPAFQEFAPQYVGVDSDGLLTISVPVTGTGAFTYQWLFNGVALGGATNDSLLLANATALNLGKYQLVASNRGGAVTSGVFTVSFFDPDGSGLPVAWELTYFGATGVDANADPDGDGVSNYQEFLDGTDPTSANSVMPRLYVPTDPAGGTISVQPLKSKYQLGKVVQITALPEPGWSFMGWLGSNAAPVSGSISLPGASVTVTMNSTKWLTPQFLGSVMAWGDDANGQTDVLYSLGTAVAVAGGDIFSLALQSNGTVAAWGDNTLVADAANVGLSNVVAIAAGSSFGLALRSNGTVAGWGYNTYGQIAVPTGLSHVVAIACGDSHSLALRDDGTVVAWGANGSGQATVPVSLRDVVAISGGYNHSLALLGDGTVVGWGANGYGDTTAPAGLSNVVAIAAGYYSSLALRSDGTVVGWGYNSWGETTPPAGLSNVVAIAAGSDFSMALQDSGTVVAWGYNYYGQTTVPADLSHAVAIAAGSHHCLAAFNNGSPFIVRQPIGGNLRVGGTALLSVGGAGTPPLSYQWQLNGTNLPGATAATLSLADAQPANSGVYAVVLSNALGTARSLGVTWTVSNSAPIILTQPASLAVRLGAGAAFSVVAAGPSPFGYQWQFKGTNIAGATQATLSLTNVTAASFGSYRAAVSNTFGVTFSSNAVLGQAPALVVAWGDNSYGQTNVPTGLGSAVAVAAGSHHSLALQSDGTVVAWGDNVYGQSTIPDWLTNVVAIAAGQNFSMGLLGDGTVLVGGDDTYGQADVPAGLSNVVAIAGGYTHGLALTSDGMVTGWGDNSAGEITMPPGLNNVVAISAGGAFSLALQANGTVTAWGTNYYGETAVPAGLTNVVAIAAGFNHSLALEAGGTVVAWGGNGSGQSTVPAGLSNVVAIAAGGLFSLALRADGTMVAWGYNHNGQAKVPAGLSNVVAIAAGGIHSLAALNDGSPFITRQPLSANLYSGATASLSVGVVGSPPLSYQWQLNGLDILGAVGPTLTLTDVRSADAGVYALVVSNALGTTSSVSATLMVSDSAPVVLVQPASQTVGLGSNAVLSVVASGSLPLSYQWQFNGTNLAGATQTALSLTAAQPTNSGVYTVVISNPSGQTNSAGATLTVSLPAPLILVQPASRAAMLGANAAFSVVAAGSLPLNYQWQLNAKDIAGATQTTLSLAKVALTNFGNYRVVITNSFGTAYSSNAALSQALSSVVAWGANSKGQTNVPPGLGTVVATAGGGYFGLALQDNGTVVAWGDNTYGQTTVPGGVSNVVAIAAGYNHGLALQGDGTVVAWGDDSLGQTDVPASLSNVVAIASGGAFSLALQGDGTVVAWGDNGFGETDVPAGLSNVVAIAAGGTFCLALQGSGTVVAWGDNGFGETNVPAGLSNVVAIAAGSYHHLALEDNGMVVAWGINSSGATNVPVGLSNVVAVAAGRLFSLALQGTGMVAAWGDNTYGQAAAPAGLSNVVSIAAGALHSLAVFNNGSPIIIRQPVGGNLFSGATASLSVGVAGPPPLRYLWQFNGTNVVGATNATLVLPNVQPARSGVYAVVVSNALGTATSAGATLTVSNSAPVILAQPTSQAVPLGANASFSVAATGSLPLLGYQWQFNGTTIAGATLATLNLPNAAATNAGNYRVAVSNAFGTTFSAIVTLNLGPANDMFARRIAIPGSSQTVTGSNAFASKEPGEPDHAGNSGGSSMWWTWTAPTNGFVTIDTLGSSFDTLLGVYTGDSVSNLTLVASDDDYSGLRTSLVTFTAATGTAYQIVVDGFGSTTGTVVLTVSQSPPGPPMIVANLQNQTVDWEAA